MFHARPVDSGGRIMLLNDPVSLLSERIWNNSPSVMGKSAGAVTSRVPFRLAEAVVENRAPV